MNPLALNAGLTFPLDMDLATKVFEWRKARGWTQVRAARWYGCSERTWRRWETGELGVPLAVVRRLRLKSTTPP